MKLTRLKIGLLLVSCSVLLVACQSKEKATTTKTDTKVETKTKKETPTKKQDKQVDASNNNQTKKNETGREHFENIPYPVFYQFDTDEAINQTIKNYAQSLHELYNVDTSKNLTTDYQITLENEQYISIHYTGDLAEGAYPSKFNVGLNIDVTTGQKMPLNQVIPVNDALAQQLTEKLKTILTEKDTDFDTVFPTEKGAILNMISDDNVEATAEFQYYLTNDRVHFIFNVPHAVGDNVEVSVER